MSTRYVVMTAALPGKGKRRRVAIVKINTPEPPARINPNYKSIEEIYSDQVHGPDTYEAAVEGAAIIAANLNRPTKPTTFTCPRCKGKGRIDHFGHVEHGVCFACNGTGTISRKRQWDNIYPVYLESTEEEKHRIRWAFHATPAQWAAATDEQIEKAVNWFESGPLTGLMEAPQPVVDRHNALLEAQPKPF